MHNVCGPFLWPPVSRRRSRGLRIVFPAEACSRPFFPSQLKCSGRRWSLPLYELRRRAARSALHALSRPLGSPGRTPWFGMRFRATARDGLARSGSSVFASWREAPAARGRMTFAASECGDRARVAGRLSYGKSAFDPPRGAFFYMSSPITLTLKPMRRPSLTAPWSAALESRGQGHGEFEPRCRASSAPA